MMRGPSNQSETASGTAGITSGKCLLALVERGVDEQIELSGVTGVGSLIFFP
jgi:hypothetical protein